MPQTNPWFFGDDHLPGQKGGQRQRLLDNAAFLHEVQNKFYARFVKAIRDAGYKGPLCGSPWQAPAMLPHYYNLRSDYLVGYIDRHNYFGGGLLDSMLAKPGSGYFSSGLQQVVDRPFGLSEWITRLSVALQRRGAGDHRRLRHGPAGLGRLLRVPVAGRPRGLRRSGRLAALGRLGSRRAHPDRPVPGPGPHDLPRRRRRRPR